VIVRLNGEARNLNLEGIDFKAPVTEITDELAERLDPLFPNGGDAIFDLALELAGDLCD
jgi:hypothetical protein